MPNEETPVSQAAGMTADDLLNQWTEQEADDAKETAEAVEPEKEPEPDPEQPDPSDPDDSPIETPPAPVETPAAPEVVPPAAGQPSPVVVDAQPVAVPELADIDKELAEIEKEIDAIDFFDPDQPKALLKKLAGTIKSQRDVTKSAKFWGEHELGSTAKKIWNEALKKHAARGLTGGDLNIAASTEWELRCEQAKSAANARAAKDPKPQAKVTPGAARVTPVASRNKPPSTPKTYEEKLTAGSYGPVDEAFDL